MTFSVIFLLIKLIIDKDPCRCLPVVNKSCSCFAEFFIAHCIATPTKLLLIKCIGGVDVVIIEMQQHVPGSLLYFPVNSMFSK